MHPAVRLAWAWLARAASAAAILSAASARAADTELAFSVGYSHFSIDDNHAELHRSDGARFEPRITWSPFDFQPQVRVGVGVGFSFYTERFDRGDTVLIGDDFVILNADSFQDLWLFEPEFQLSWRQQIGDEFYIEPGAGVGALVADFREGKAFADILSDTEHERWTGNFEFRPFLRAGWRWAPDWAAGLEGSYLFSHLDLGHGGEGDVNELYVGVFLSGRL